MDQQSRNGIGYHKIGEDIPKQGAQTRIPPAVHDAVPQASTHSRQTPSINEKNPVKLPWPALATMFGSLCVAVVLSTGHHLFYLYHDQQSVDGSIGQTWVNNIGTGLKTMAIIAAGTAYVQLQWQTIRKRPFRLSQLDVMFGVSRDITAVFRSRLWMKQPALLALALIPWSIPLSAVVTPGTLSVQPASFRRSTTAWMPHLDYNASKFAGTALGDRYIIQPEPALSRLAFSTAMSGRKVGLSSPFQNMSYETEFVSPGIHCAHVSNWALVKQVREKLYREMKDGYPGYDLDYVSWVPRDILHDFTNDDISKATLAGSQSWSTIDQADLSVYVMPSPSSTNFTDLLECRLGNYSYHATFNFTYPLQFVNVKSRRWLNDPVYQDYDSAPEYWHMQASYKAIMDAFGRLVVGSSISELGDTATFKSRTAINWTTTELSITGLESLFENITFSPPSSDELTEKRATNVTFTESANIYVYDARSLLLAYTISLGCALLCTLAGLLSILTSGASYSNAFSTVFRATQGLDILVDADDSGADPLPEELARAAVDLGAVGRERKV